MPDPFVIADQCTRSHVRQNSVDEQNDKGDTGAKLDFGFDGPSHKVCRIRQLTVSKRRSSGLLPETSIRCQYVASITIGNFSSRTDDQCGNAGALIDPCITTSFQSLPDFLNRLVFIPMR